MLPAIYRNLSLASVALAVALGAHAEDALLDLATDDSVSAEIRAAAQRTVARLVAPPAGNVADAALNDYLNRLLERIEPGSNYFIGIASRNDINAFATVGGVIMIYSGLWLASDDEQELAGVVAHEIAHQRLQHIRRGTEKAERDTVLSIAAAAAALLVGDDRLQDALLLSNPAALASSQLSHSREFEAEADSIGFDLLARARIDPKGLVRFLSKIQEVDYAGSLPEYLRTHPVSTNRIAALNNRIQSRPTASTMEGIEFLLMRERLAVLTRSEEDTIEKRLNDVGLSSLVSFPREKIAALYGLLLHAAREKDPQAFASAERMIRASGRTHPLISEALAAGMHEIGRSAEALLELGVAVARHPEHYPLAALQSQLLSRTPDAAALAVIRGHIRRFGERHELLMAEAAALSGLGMEVQHHLRLSLAALLEGRIGAAGKQIRIARRAGERSGLSLEQRRELKEIEERYEDYKSSLSGIFSS